MGYFEKLALERELRTIWSSLEGRDKVIEELRAEVSRQLDRYADLWFAHETLLEEAQKLRSKVIALRLVIQVEGVGDSPGSRTRAPRVLSPDLEGRDISLGDRPTMLRVLVVGMREL